MEAAHPKRRPRIQMALSWKDEEIKTITKKESQFWLQIQLSTIFWLNQSMTLQDILWIYMRKDRQTDRQIHISCLHRDPEPLPEGQPPNFSRVFLWLLLLLVLLCVLINLTREALSRRGTIPESAQVTSAVVTAQLLLEVYQTQKFIQFIPDSHVCYHFTVF